MKRLLLTTLGLSLCFWVYAQEGIAYKGTNGVTEKEYSVKYKFGKNKLHLETINSCLYNSEGYILEKRSYRANKTYLGRTTFNRSSNPQCLEVVTYNHMNQLSDRSIEIVGENPNESTKISYDTRGNILNKAVKRLYVSTGETWTLNYNQVGYVDRYSRSSRDSTDKIIEETIFNYFDEPIEKHYLSYSQSDQLLSREAYSTTDTLISKHTYTYDDVGNLIEESSFDNVGSILETLRYSYDEQNRMIQKSHIIWNPRFGVTPRLTRLWEYSYNK